MRFPTYDYPDLSPAAGDQMCRVKMTRTFALQGLDPIDSCFSFLTDPVTASCLKVFCEDLQDRSVEVQPC